MEEIEEQAEESQPETLGVEMPAFPLFCVTKHTEEVPSSQIPFILIENEIRTNSQSQYRAILNNSTRSCLVKWTEITSNPPARDILVAHLNADKIDNEKKGYPFLNSDFPSIHEYWHRNPRPAQDSLNWAPIAHDTYLVIDQECVPALPDPEIIIFTNAPDYDNFDEVEPLFKLLRLPIRSVFLALNMFDALTATPSEAL
jgi:hypothetical protein